MHSLEDFKTIQVQATIFTPDLRFQSGKALACILSRWPEILTKVVFATDLPTGTPLEIPHVVIQSDDTRIKLQAGPSRLDLLWVTSDILSIPIDCKAHLDWCCEVFELYKKAMSAKVGRMACVISRIAFDEAPAISIAQHFCKPLLVEEGGAFVRLSDFELHAAKKWVLNDRFTVNSWVRCKSAKLHENPLLKSLTESPKGIYVEQDINTLVEELNTRQFSTDSIREFFSLAPDAFSETISLYFPKEASQ